MASGAAGMIRRGGSVGPENTVLVHVSGPKFIFMAETPLNQTWNRFLGNNGVPEGVRRRVFIRTWKSANCQRSSEGHWGWTAQVNERIGKFVSKYNGAITTTNSHCSVMLCVKEEESLDPLQMPLVSDPGTSGRPVGPSGVEPRPVIGSSKAPDAENDELPTDRQLRLELQEARVARAGGLDALPEPEIGFQVARYLPGPKVNGGRQVPLEKMEVSTAETDDDDAMSIMTAADEEEEELWRQGIQVEDVKPRVEERLKSVGTEYLKKTRVEGD